MYLQNTVKKVSINMYKMISVFVIWVWDLDLSSLSGHTVTNRN